jgi:hypothetical protein
MPPAPESVPAQWQSAPASAGTARLRPARCVMGFWRLGRKRLPESRFASGRRRKSRMRISVALNVAVTVTLVTTALAHAQKKYDPGASDTEIKLGQTLPYSGPVSVLSGVGKGETAYFRFLNEAQSGINGRKVTLLSLDDGYSAPKTMELTRRLVERDNVLAFVNTVGTATNHATHRYLNQKKVPQLLILATRGLDAPIGEPNRPHDPFSISAAQRPKRLLRRLFGGLRRSHQPRWHALLFLFTGKKKNRERKSIGRRYCHPCPGTVTDRDFFQPAPPSTTPSTSNAI